MAKIRHIAIRAEDVEATAKLFTEVFGLELVQRRAHGPIDLSDGDVNITLLPLRLGGREDEERPGYSHIGFTVEDHEFGDTTNGDCSASGRRIRVESRNSPAQRAKTLAHEIAHALLHNRVDDRALAELEAESTAYVVCRSVGLDPGDYSFGYVATWAGGGAEAIVRIKTSCDRIQKAAAFILRSLDDGAKRPGPLVATGSSRARPLSKQP